MKVSPSFLRVLTHLRGMEADEDGSPDGQKVRRCHCLVRIVLVAVSCSCLCDCSPLLSFSRSNLVLYTTLSHIFLLSSHTYHLSRADIPQARRNSWFLPPLYVQG